MFVSTEFMYDGKYSKDMGVVLIASQSGATKTLFGFGRSIGKDMVNDIVYSSRRFSYNPITFTISIAKIEPDDLDWDFDTKTELVRWLYQDEYKPFISLDNPEIIYYCKAVGEGERYDTGHQQGYATIKMECNSPYAFTPSYLYEWDKEYPSDIIDINNLSNVQPYYYPEIEINFTNSTEVSIINLSNAGQEFNISGVDLGETIYINNQMKRVLTDKEDVNRLESFNKQWLELVQGHNLLKVHGDVEIIIKATYPIAV